METITIVRKKDKSTIFLSQDVAGLKNFMEEWN
jgi:hypothetical protein